MKAGEAEEQGVGLLGFEGGKCVPNTAGKVLLQLSNPQVIPAWT